MSSGAEPLSIAKDHFDIIVIGAGAAGVFAALRAKELSPQRSVVILEKSKKPLRKVSISGGGRCNVTHDCDDLDVLLRAYPRGGPRLEVYLSRFMPYDTVEWFQSRGVKLKTESDGRMFPTSDDSATIVSCLMKECEKLGVRIWENCPVKSVKGRQGCFRVQTQSGELEGGKLLLATGGASKATQWLGQWGHQLSADIPSLFTFCCDATELKGLSGLSVAKVSLELDLESSFFSEGPLLITHWGLSGPAALKLSSFAARELYQRDYRANLRCDFLPEWKEQDVLNHLLAQDTAKQLVNHSPFPELPKRLWAALVGQIEIKASCPWHSLGETRGIRLADALKSWKFLIDGKGVFKDEFVTSGGLPLHEVDCYTMESKRVSGLYVAGELLNVDGVTGGFNFQNAWASGFVAGEGLSG